MGFSFYWYIMAQKRNQKVVYRALFLSRIIIAAGIWWVVTNSGTQDNLPDDTNQADGSDNQ